MLGELIFWDLPVRSKNWAGVEKMPSFHLSNVH